MLVYYIIDQLELDRKILSVPESPQLLLCLNAFIHAVYEAIDEECDDDPSITNGKPRLCETLDSLLNHAAKVAMNQLSACFGSLRSALDLILTVVERLREDQRTQFVVQNRLLETLLDCFERGHSPSQNSQIIKVCLKLVSP